MKRWITPLKHPAAIMRGQWSSQPVQVAYLQRLAAMPNPILVDVSKPPPGCLTAPTLGELRAFVEEVEAAAPCDVVFDIENAGPQLICCGMLILRSTHLLDISQDSLMRGVCFRVRRQGGGLWWAGIQHNEAMALMRRVLGNEKVRKVGHFIVQHDIPLLEDAGFPVRGPILDTSVLLHAVHSEMRKGLQFAATLFCGAPRWKDIPDEKGDADEPAGEEV